MKNDGVGIWYASVTEYDPVLRSSCRLGKLGVVLLLSAIAAAADAPKPHALTTQQKNAMLALQGQAEKKAAPIALHFAEVVKRVYGNMLAEHPDEALRTQLDQEMKDTTWELLLVKGQEIRDSVGLLDAEQKRILREEMAKPGAPSDLAELIGKVF